MDGNELINFDDPGVLRVRLPEEDFRPNFTVLKLSDLALKFLIQRVVDELPNINEKTLKSWIESYQSIRELIMNIHLFDSYQSLSMKILNTLEGNDESYEKAKFLLWQCFENIDTKRLSCCQLLEIDNKILGHGADGKIFSEVMTSQEKFLKCEALAFKFYILPAFLISENILGKLGVSKDTLEYPFDQIGQFFEKMPNLIEINITYLMKTSIQKSCLKFFQITRT